MECLFWSSVVLMAYAYFGYPLLLLMVSRIRNCPIREGDYTPYVTLIVAVHNEAATIRTKIENLLALQYPADLLQIIIVSDSSKDGTDDIIREYQSRGITHLRLDHRAGKHFAQREALPRAQGEILAFTDASPMLDSMALSRMVRYYADPHVGCVSSEDRVLTDAQAAGEERGYIRYLMALRKLETRIGSVVGLSGSFFSVRKVLCNRWWVDRSSDFFLALEAVRRGFRAVHHPESLHYYRVTKSPKSEFRRKRRTVINGLVVFFHSLDLLNPFRYGLFSWQLLSHKFLRWSVPLFMAMALVSSLALARGSTFFTCALFAQIAFYAIAAASLLWPAMHKIAPLRWAGFVCFGNAAVFMAWLDVVLGRTESIWEPTRRVD